MTNELSSSKKNLFDAKDKFRKVAQKTIRDLSKQRDHLKARIKRANAKEHLSTWSPTIRRPCQALHGIGESVPGFDVTTVMTAARQKLGVDSVGFPYSLDGSATGASNGGTPG